MSVDQVLFQPHIDHILFSFGFYDASSRFGSEDHMVSKTKLRTGEDRVSSHYDPVLVALLSQYITEYTSMQHSTRPISHSAHCGRLYLQ